MPLIPEEAARREKQGPKLYPEAELASLVRSLDRPKDAHLFSEDVVKAYPQLAAAYVKLCPQRCDLATAARNAMEGKYSHDASLELLRQDVQRMVSNCVRFNGESHPYAAVAADFERFALREIESYIARKTGGRRPSTLRVLHTAQRSAVPATTPSPTADGGRKDAADTPGASASDAPSRKDVAHLVSSLVRREDGGAFVVDVAETYPELREAYETACPRRTNLSNMKRRALDGDYTGAGAVATTVADSLAVLRDDVELIVANCIRFNARVPAWVTLAHSFRAFAHRRIDDFVLRRAPQLRGTQTGSERYEQPPTSEPSATASTATGDAAPAPDAVAAVKRTRDDSSTPAAQAVKRHADSATVAVHAITAVAPSVRPMAVQPSLAVPPRLRQRLVTDYICRDSRRLLRVGEVAPVAELCSPPPGAAPPPAPFTVAAEATADASSAPAAAAAQCVEAPVTDRMSVQAVLDAFGASVKRFYETQRSRQDFTDPFLYSTQEEAAYLQITRVLLSQFNALLPQALLYEQESVELRQWTAQLAVSRCRTAQADDADAAGGDVQWARRVHYKYLVRLLVQFPQLASLAVSAVDSTPSGAVGRGARGERQQSSAGGGSIHISRTAVAVMQHVAKATQELLLFIDAFEERLAAQLAHA